MSRLLVVDDRPVFAAGVERIAADAGLAVDVLRHVPAQGFDSRQSAAGYDAIVVGVTSVVPGDTGRLALQHLKRLPGTPPALAVCTPCESVYGVRLLRDGARGVVSAQASPAEMATALSATLAGRRYLSEALTEHLLAHVLARPESDPIRLRDAVASEAQLRIVQLIALGKPIDVICSTLRISCETAHAHRRDILARTGLADEQELKRRAFEQRLVPDRRGRARHPGQVRPAA